MSMRPLPFPLIWVAGDLGEFRPCDSTYCRYDARTLPRLPTHLFDGSYSWLRRHRSPLDYDARFAGSWGANGPAKWNELAQTTQPQLLSAARECGVTLPDSFVNFLFDGTLVTMIRSSTDCSFSLPRMVTRNNGPVPGHFVHFLSDSQNCYEWYLFIDQKGEHCVVASSENLSEPDLPDTFWENRRDEIVACADSFEAFVYRLWIENEIWFRLVNQDQPMTDEMNEYLAASQNSREEEL